MNEIIAWLGRQFWNQTFDDDVEVKVDEIRELLDLSDDCGEDVVRFSGHATLVQVEQYDYVFRRTIMPAYLISGPSGSGKSSVGRELQSRGYKVVETDFEPGFSGWFNNETGKKVVNLPPLPNSKKWFEAHSWLWDSAKVKELASGSTERVFFCGGAYNEKEFYDLFDLRFALHTDSQTLINRLRPREPKRWSDGSPDLQKLLDWNGRFEAYSLKAGAILVDSSAPITKVVDEILSHIEQSKAGLDA